MIASLGALAPVIEGGGHFIAHNATLIGDMVIIDRMFNGSIWLNAVLRGDNDTITIGERSNVQDAAVLHTDPGIQLTIGGGVTIGHQAMLHGCSVGDNSLIGIGSTILNRAVIGRNSVVGAHALITEGKTFPDGVLIIGAPARVARELEAEEIAGIERSADVYVANAARYLGELTPRDT